MSENYSTVLTRCMGLSAAGLATALLGIFHPLVPFALAMVPLVWYHLGYLRKFAGEGISQPAVDSVYYYGFLVTIGALGVTALELSLKGVDGDLTAVAFQFGLGLLATGYAVWARIHLTASSRLLDEANLEEAMHRYVDRSRELISTVEIATASFENYANSVVDKLQLFASRVEQETQASINAAAEQLKQAATSMAEESKLALMDLRGIINDTTFGAERDALRAGVTSMVETVNALSASLTELKTNSSASAASVGSLASGLGEVTTHAASAAGRLEVLGKKDGTLENFADALSHGEKRISEFGLSADVAASSATALSDTLSSSGDNVVAFSGAAKQGAAAFSKLNASEVALSGFAAQLTNAADELKTAANSASGSKASFEQLTTSLAGLQETLEHLNSAIIDSTGGLKDSMISTSEALEDHLQKALAQSASLSQAVHDRRFEPLTAEGAINGTS